MTTPLKLFSFETGADNTILSSLLASYVVEEIYVSPAMALLKYSWSATFLPTKSALLVMIVPVLSATLSDL
ncbi:hypothetical protein SDC9_65247 [bioreactor metagenome]|uniref:Uncharacterized protein n=1 Tax=bioreactor metagenome TaxID=1076179 RepID=A0A644XRG7_9ZZZZ